MGYGKLRRAQLQLTLGPTTTTPKDSFYSSPQSYPIPIKAISAMSRIAYTAFAALAGLLSPSRANHVVDLGVANFDEFVSSHHTVMVEFYAPWCAICQEVEPIYETAASMLDGSRGVKFARVDCTNDTVLCDKYRTPIYPTMRVFQGLDSQVIYNGLREPVDMITFAEKRAVPAVTQLNGLDIEEFRQNEDIVVVGFWDAKDQASNQTFNRLAEEHIDYYSFGATNDADAASRYGISQPGIALFKKYDEPQMNFMDTFEDDAVTDFVNLNSIPLVGTYSHKWGWRYFGEGTLPLVAAFASTMEEREMLAATLRPLAEKYKDIIRFVIVDAVQDERLIKRFELSDRDLPTIAIRNPTGQLFHTPGDIGLTEQSLTEWVDAYQRGSLKAYSKEDELQNVSDESVMVLDESNFDELVMDPKYDVLVEFYAPWCGHCKRLAPTYGKLASAIAETSKNVRIAKIDATAHKIPAHPVSSYPTILYFPADDKVEPISYNGDRSIKDMTRFIREGSGRKLQQETIAKDEL